MVRVRLAVAVLATVALSGCMTSLPTPDYVSVKTPAPYRVSPEGARIDNENYALDSEGYRVNDKGERVGVLDVPVKTAGEQSNPVAGYYISSQGQVAPGKVAQIKEPEVVAARKRKPLLVEQRTFAHTTLPNSKI